MEPVNCIVKSPSEISEELFTFDEFLLRKGCVFPTNQIKQSSFWSIPTRRPPLLLPELCHRSDGTLELEKLRKKVKCQTAQVLEKYEQ